MPRYYSYGAQPRRYGQSGEIEGLYTARAAETASLGDRYLGPVRKADLGGSLGSYFGDQDLGASNFGGQNKDLGAAMLSNNEKTLVMIGVLGLVGWLAFGKQIKKGFKSNPSKNWSAKARANMKKGLTPAGNKKKKRRLSAFQRAVRDYRAAGYTKAQAEHEAREDILRR